MALSSFRHCHRTQHMLLPLVDTSSPGLLSSFPGMRGKSLLSAWLLLKGTFLFLLSSRTSSEISFKNLEFAKEREGPWLQVVWFSAWPSYQWKEIIRPWLPAWNRRQVTTKSILYTLISRNPLLPKC